MEKNEPTYANGKICYIEIPSVDINVSATFYEKCFGWQIRHRDNGEVSFDDTVGQVSGMWVTNRKAATEIGFVISIMVDDITASMNLVKANGGKIIKQDIDGQEKTAWFNDPTGNVFGLYQQ